MSDGDKDAHQVELFRRSVLHILDAHAGYPALVAQHFVQHVVPLDGHISGVGLLDQLVGQDLLGAEFVAPVHHGDMGGDVGQVKGLFHGRVAAADHRYLLILVEESVARGTGGNAAALELFL